MSKEQALATIQTQIDTDVNPVDLLNWVWLRLFILKVPDADWDRIMDEVSGGMR